jgi:hypothetical protein
MASCTMLCTAVYGKVKWQQVTTSSRRDGAVSIPAGYWLDGRGVGVRVPVRARFFFSTSATPVLGLTQPPIQRVPRTLSLGVKQPGREAYHSPPTSAEVKNAGIDLSIHSPHTFSWRSA